jgi:hypothetical protein
MRERKIMRDRNEGRNRERKKYRWPRNQFQKAQCREMLKECGT